MQHANVLLANSIALSSATTYESGLRKFKRFIERIATTHQQPMPATHSPEALRDLLALPVITATFIASLALEGLAAKTIGGYVAAVTHAATDLHGHPAELPPGTKLVLRGATLLGPLPRPPRPYIGLGLLKRMCQHLPCMFESLWECTLYRAIFTTAFFGCFRVSEYLKSRDTRKCLKTGDVILLGEEQMVIHLKKTKTNQHGNVQSVILLGRPEDPSTMMPGSSHVLFPIAIRMVGRTHNPPTVHQRSGAPWPNKLPRSQ